MNINALLEVLFGFMIVVGIALCLFLIVFIFWTAWFIPVIKLRKHNEEKQKHEAELHKIEIRKADAIIMVDDKKAEYSLWHVKAEQEKLELEKLQKKKTALIEQQENEASTKKGNGKKVPAKT